MKREPKILFVTNKDDLAVDYLIDKLSATTDEYVRLNSEDISQFGINVSLSNGPILSICDEIWSLNTLRSAYFRRAPSVFPPTVDAEDAPFINRERRHFLEGLYCSLNIQWVNPIFATYEGERKIYQLHLAKQVGLNIPDTLLSNKLPEVKEFLSNHSQCIIKPISFGLQTTEMGSFSIYTSPISSKDFDSSQESIFECPVFIQERIQNFRDIRLTIVGERVFAIEIEKTDSNEVDWRRPDLVKQYKNHNLPKHIEKACLELHRRLKLKYSATDFILAPDGKYVFLEVNPAGEWVWLDRILDGAISSEFIALLLKNE